MKGYKYTIRKSDKKPFMITAECNDYFLDNGKYKGKAFYTTDCIIQRIEDKHGNTIDRIDGTAIHSYIYYVGQEIKGEKIWFFDDLEYCWNYIWQIEFSKDYKLSQRMLDAYLKSGEMAMKDPSFLLCCALGTDSEQRKNAFENARMNCFIDEGFTLQDYFDVEKYMHIHF